MKKLLDENSYDSIKDKIVDKIKNTKATTIEGNERLQQMYLALNESTTPIIELRKFKNESEHLLEKDAKLGEVFEFIKKHMIEGSGDLNFLINLVKEEHYANLKADGHLDPSVTIKQIESEFSQPASVVEEAIKQGIFDTMRSDMLNVIKKQMQVKKTKGSQLNESNLIDNKILKYNPIGVQVETDDKIVFLIESNTFEYNDELEQLTPIMESSVVIPKEAKFLEQSLKTLNYDNKTQTFKLFENWDFNLTVNSAGIVKVNDHELTKEQTRDLLLESIKVYNNNPTKVRTFNKENYIKDADNLLLLLENFDSVVQFSNLDVYRNLNESSYVMFDSHSYNSRPTILSSNKGSFKFKTYKSLVESMNDIVGTKFGTKLFESQLSHESDLVNLRSKKLKELTESQKVLNKKLSDISRLKTIAENESPAMNKLMEQENVINQKLDENLSSLNEMQNNFALYD